MYEAIPLKYFYNQTEKRLINLNYNFEILGDRDQWIELSWYTFDSLIGKLGIIPQTFYK